MNQHPLHQEPTIPTNNQPSTFTGDVLPEKYTVVLQPIAMRIPNRHGVYSPNKLRAPKEISYKDFLSRYADYPRKIRVCFDETPSPETLLETAIFVTAYGFGLDCWYIVASVSDENDVLKT